MKLSHKPRHTAPRLRTRDLRGKLHNPPAATNSNRPGGRFSERSYREGFFSALRKKTNSIGTFEAAVKSITGVAQSASRKVLVVGKGDK